MSMSLPIPTSHSAPLQSGDRLSDERLRAGLEACGYRCTTALLSGIRTLPPGCTVSLQFGDLIAMNGDETACLTVRCSIQINGRDERITGVTCWHIRRLVHVQAGLERLCFAIEADLVLGSDIRLADILTHGGEVYRHLHMLIGDAGATLRDLSFENRRTRVGGAPGSAAVMRIEARFFGDLAAGRSGLVASDGAGCFGHSAEVVARHIQITRAACDWLKDDILPDLASAIRRMVLQAQTTIRYRSPQAPPVTIQQSDAQSQRHECVTQRTDDAAATLVPAQSQ